jgi:phosphatidylserine/phosphatidylglycerophosphate/cardiolipin synthase-like enzyme
MRVSSPSLVAPADSVVTSVADRRSTVVNVIRSARRRIDLSLFRCNDREIFGELARATARGVRVDVLVTPRARGGAKKLARLWSALQKTGASLHVYGDPLVKYHAKYLVVDDGPALVASFNFTLKCFERTCDAFVLTHDSEVVSGLRALMAADREGRGMPRSLTRRLIVGPERSRWQLTSLIEDAQSSIRVIDAKLSDPELVRLLNARRADGVVVEVYRSKRLGSLKSHGKILLIDDRIAVIGSLALAPISLDFRREVAIIVDEPEAVAEVARLFRTIRLSRMQPCGPTPGRNSDAPTAARPAIAAARLEALC